jgi:hypothetical protein
MAIPIYQRLDTAAPALLPSISEWCLRGATVLFVCICKTSDLPHIKLQRKDLFGKSPTSDGSMPSAVQKYTPHPHICKPSRELILQCLAQATPRTHIRPPNIPTKASDLCLGRMCRAKHVAHLRAFQNAWAITISRPFRPFMELLAPKGKLVQRMSRAITRAVAHSQSSDTASPATESYTAYLDSQRQGISGVPEPPPCVRFLTSVWHAPRRSDSAVVRTEWDSCYQVEGGMRPLSWVLSPAAPCSRADLHL